MIQRNVRFICLFVLLGFSLLFSGCVQNDVSDAVQTPDKPLTVVTTIFPPYDFARQISGGAAQVSMLLKPGMESHSYEPSPADIISIESCDLFIYNGGESDTWIDDLLGTLDTSGFTVIKMMDCVETLEEQTVEGMQGAHDHEGDEEQDHEGETAEYDEHVWTAPENTVKITQVIAEQMMRLDPENRSLYEENMKTYVSKLQNLDAIFREITQNAKRRILLFGDRFPFRYFAEAYDLDYRAAFPGCSAESEPGAKTVAYLIDKVREENAPNIFYVEFSNQKIARAIQEETGAVPLLFHSCHNLSKDEMEQGLTYLDLMQKNAANLKEALN